MSRPLRIEYPGAVYHVMNRGLNAKRVFLDKSDYETFLVTLEEACRLFDGIVYSYCLMSNHYHLLVKTPSGNVSRFMRHLNGVYTQRFNRAHDRDGPLFRGRYKSILVQEDSYLLEVLRYIHNNPVKAKIVERLSLFKWSSHNTYLGKVKPITGMDTKFVLRYFSSKTHKAIEDYRRFISQSGDVEVEKFYSSKKQGNILGNSGFVEWVKEKYILSKPDLEISDKRRVFGDGVVTLVKNEVCRKFKVEQACLYESQRGTSNIPRLMAMLLSKELSGLKLAEIGLHFGFSSYRTVGAHCWNFRKKIEQEKQLMSKYKSLVVVCSQAKT